MKDSEIVQTYADIALNWWTMAGWPALRSRQQGDQHGPEHPCLVCADGREALGMKPMVPSWARRSVPDFYRRRFRR